MSIHRKVLAGVCATVLALSFIGCGSSDSDSSGADSSAPAEQTTTEAPEVTASPAPTDDRDDTDDTSPPTTNAEVADTVAPSGEGSMLAGVTLYEDSASSDAVQLAVGGAIKWGNVGEEDRTCSTEGGTPAPVVVSIRGERLVTFDTAGTFVVTCDFASPVTVTVTVG